jgi:uncharacterized protein
MIAESAHGPAAGGIQGIHVVAKPVGPRCNLNCDYCFYLEKKALFGSGGQHRMSDEVLAAFIAGYVSSQPTPAVEFVWQGGEPTLAGIDFFKRVIKLQKPFAGRKTITNALQTNGTLLTDQWCRFLKAHGFMVGLSLDGPRAIHDRYRRDRTGNGSFERVMRGLKLLQQHDVDYNVLACVAGETARQPLEVYRFLRGQGVEFIQFAPVVERRPDASSREQGLRLAGPASLDIAATQADVFPWSVAPEEYGDFLIGVYEEWVRRDVGRVFVMNFEWALNAWIGNPSPVCVHARTCGRAVAIEHNGDVFACDHYVYPQNRIGNILKSDLRQMVEASCAGGFGSAKETALPRWCRACDVLAACQGGCPKHRFARSPDGEPGLHYLCRGYQKFFRHIRKYLKAMATLLEYGYPAAEVMRAIEGPLVIRCPPSKASAGSPGAGSA